MEELNYINIKDDYYVIESKREVNFDSENIVEITNSVEKAQRTNIKDFKEVILKIDMKNKKILGQTIKDIIKIKKICDKSKIRLGKNYQGKNVVAIIENNIEDNQEIINIITAILYEDIKEKYNYIYDTVCDYLDNEFINNNLCDFKNDKCKVKRNTKVTMGCCHHCKNKYFGILYSNKLQMCEHLKDKRCSAKCITCKLFTCDELRKEGFKYTTENIALLKYFFNPLQKFIIISSYFTPKEKIMKKLLRCRI